MKCPYCHSQEAIETPLLTRFWCGTVLYEGCPIVESKRCNDLIHGRCLLSPKTAGWVSRLLCLVIGHEWFPERVDLREPVEWESKCFVRDGCSRCYAGRIGTVPIYNLIPQNLKQP